MGSFHGRFSAHIRSNVVGYIALFCFAIGGTANALTGTNTVDSGDIINGEVKTRDIRGMAITGSKLADNAVKNPKLADNAVGSAEIIDGSLTGTDVNEASLDSTILQSRIGGSCPAGQSIRDVSQSGTVTCETDDSGGPPSGSAGGDLAGTYPNPTIGPAAVGTNEVDGSLTGANIDESTLFNDNSLNDADIDQSTLGLAEGRTKFDYTAITGGTTNFDVSTVANRYLVRYSCPASPSSTSGTLVFGNLSSSQMNLFIDDGGANPTYQSVNSGAGPLFLTAAAGDRYVFTYQIAPGGTPPVFFGTVTVDSVHPGSGCYIQSQGWMSG